jgi:hypothetical protein
VCQNLVPVAHRVDDDETGGWTAEGIIEVGICLMARSKTAQASRYDERCQLVVNFMDKWRVNSI